MALVQVQVPGQVVALLRVDVVSLLGVWGSRFLTLARPGDGLVGRGFREVYWVRWVEGRTRVLRTLALPLRLDQTRPC